MSSPRPVSARPLLRRGAAVVVAGVLPLLLTSCGANRDAQTYQERSQADASNTAVGTLALRGVAILPPEENRTYAAGDDAQGVFVVTNSDDKADTLVGITAKGAQSVEVLVDGKPGQLEVPALGSTEERGSMRVVGLEDQLREGEYLTMTFRFENNGSVEVPVPVSVSGRTDRPTYTGKKGEKGEPALQAPTGGEQGQESGGDQNGAEGGQGVVGESELGQAEGGGETSPRSDASPSPSASGAGSASPSASASPQASALPNG